MTIRRHRLVPVFGIPFIDRINPSLLGHLEQNDAQVTRLLTLYFFVSLKKMIKRDTGQDLDVWMSQYELPKRRIKCEAIDTVSSAQNKLRQISHKNQYI